MFELIQRAGREGSTMNEEAAKAVQETAKATGKALDVVQSFGKFVGRFVSGPLEQGTGIVEDILKHYRWKNGIGLQIKAEKYLQQLGMASPTKPMPLKVAVPFFQAALLEESDSIQDMWAALLVNSTNADADIDLRRSYVGVLENFTPLDARILQTLYSAPKSEATYDGFWTRGFPDAALPAPMLAQAEVGPPLPKDVKLSFVNLDRLDCLRLEEAFYGGQMFDKVHKTVFGQFFFEACTVNEPLSA